MTPEHAPLWGGGFVEAMHPALADISHSLAQDAPLADADLRASAAYARALGRCGVLQAVEAQTLSDGLDDLRTDLAAGRFVPAGTEDVHTAIETEITARLGALGERLHTGRSRNDQVSTAFRLAVSERLDVLMVAVRDCVKSLCRRAEEEIDTLMPSYTHLQRAQPIRLGHWLMAQAWPLLRDCERLQAAKTRALSLPLGVGAVSGHPFGIDREYLRQQLGFVSITENSLDTVGERDFALEAAFACAMVALHLSRLCEDLVLWSSAEFNYLRWPDGLATGSSLMPNKKNPDLAELVRGRSAAAVGDLVQLLVLVKGLPTSYQRDLQEDKPPVWRMTAGVLASVRAVQVALDAVRFERAALAAALTDDTLATEMADLLVQHGVPFRQAHHKVAAHVAEARRRGVGLRALAAASDYTLPAPLTVDDVKNLDVVRAIERRQAPGGTARDAVMSQIATARARLGEQEQT